MFRTLVPAPVRAAAAVLFLIDNGDAAAGEGPGVFPRSFWEKKTIIANPQENLPSITTYYNPIHGMYDPIYNQI